MSFSAKCSDVWDADTVEQIDEKLLRQVVVLLLARWLTKAILLHLHLSAHVQCSFALISFSCETWALCILAPSVIELIIDRSLP